MPEPMVQVAPRRNYQPLTRAQLRKRYGPSNPLYPILETLITSDVSILVDDDFNVDTLSTTVWNVGGGGGAAAANFAVVANTPCGKIRGDTGTDDDNGVFLASGDENATPNRRPVLIGRIGTNAAVAGSKFEFGFIDAESNTGAVLVKATPTSTQTDYAVIIRDTDDNTSVDLVCDGTTDAIQKVTSSPGITYTTQTWYDMMIAMNEQKETMFYIDGVFQGVATRGPDVTTTMAVWLFNQNRADADTAELDCDFIKGWQERVPFSGDAFTT